MIVSLLNEKGGVGKTTLATNLACFYAHNGLEVFLVDADPQGTAMDWHSMRDGVKCGSGEVACVSLPSSDLEKKIAPLYRNADVVLIDTPGTLSPVTVSAIKASGVSLLPVMPSAGDLWAVQDAVEVVEERRAIAGAPEARFVVSCAKVGTRLTREVNSALSSLPFPALDGRTHNREVYKRALGEGRSVLDYDAPKAEKEITQVAEETSAVYQQTPHHS